MTLLPELKQTLHEAVDRGVFAPRPRRRTRWIALGSTTAVLTIGGVAAAAGLWHPHLGSSDRPVTRATTPLAVSRTSGLAVLERPQSDADRSGIVEQALTKLSPAGMDRVDTDGIRLLGTHAAGVALLLPVARSGPGGAAHPELTDYQQLCLVFTTTTAATQHCASAAGLRAGKLAGFVPKDHDGIITGQSLSHSFGIVPDGVAAVRITFDDGTSQITTVRSNFYDAATSSVAAPRSVAWLDRAGRTVGPSAAHVRRAD